MADPQSRFFKSVRPSGKTRFGRAERFLAAVAAAGELTAELPLVVFSPLDWDTPSEGVRGVFASIAESRTVVIVEEPMPAAEAGVPDSWDLHMPQARLLVARPILEAASAGFVGTPHRPLVRMLRELLRWFDVSEHVAWLQTPAALPVAQRLLPDLLVYDRIAPAGPRAPREHEEQLLAEADVVFAPDRERREAARCQAAAARMLAELELAARRLLAARAGELRARA